MSTVIGTMSGVIARPIEPQGIWGWITTIDHKRIGILYGVSAFVFFLIGGIEAMMIRLQLSIPDNKLIDPDTYNQLFTMHGTTMIFLGVMPMGAAFFNYIIPLQIGARDVAFPRLNAFSYWVFISGGLLLNSSFIFGGAPNSGWFGYANLTSKAYNAGHGVDFWVLGLLVLGTSSMAAAFNFIVTILNLRAPGMSLMRMPLFTWMTLVVSFLLIFAFPVITVALIELLFDRFFGTNFFNPANGGDVVLWQHLFWLFGHPEVYILILPAMGMVSEVLPTFAKKPLFGYPVVVLSGVTIGFMGWGVWAHHMFTVGLGPVANTVFALTTMLIAIPTGVKIFNWIATLWGGSIDLKTANLFALGFIALFTIGGLSGVSHASPPSNYQQQDTYYIVAHFHYVLFTGAIFGIFGGIYYWWPKITGRLLNEGLGKIHFWLIFIGGNLTFGPMHILGMDGMPRRVYTYPKDMGWDFWNQTETVGTFFIAISILVFLYNIFQTFKKGELAGNDPWDARTLEWSIPSPPPHYNFATIPVVHGRDAFWMQKYPDAVGAVGAVRHGAPAAVHAPTHEESYLDHHSIHMPSPSYLPFLTAMGQLMLFAGFLVGFWLSGIGLVLILGAIYAWGSEPIAE